MLVTKSTPRPYLPVEERDQQRSRLYAAEKLALGNKTKRLPTVKDIEEYVRKVQGRAVLVKRFGSALTNSIYVGDGRMRRSAGGDRYGIYMPIWSRCEYLVLHELAHTITIRLFGDNVSAHGWKYANVYLQLVKSMLGSEHHDALKNSFKQHRVRIAPKKTRAKVQVTPELLERLARAREARKQSVSK